MSATTIFIGSSAAAKSQAKAIVRKFSSPKLKFLPWWDAFTAGRTLLKDLDHVRGRFDAALLLFELGYFYGHFGEKKVAMLKYGEFYLPSDLGGYIHILGSCSFRRGAAVPVGKRTARDFERWVAAL